MISSRTGTESRILVAHRDAAALGALSWLLREHGYAVNGVSDPDALLRVAEAWPPDLVLVEVDHGESRTAQALASLRADARWRDVPVIVAGPAEGVVAKGDGNGRGVRAWADDYVGTPIRASDLLARLRAQLRAHQELRRTREALRQTEEELERVRENAEHNRRLVDILHEVTGELSSNEIYRILARRVARALDISHASVVLADAGDAMGVVAAAYEDPAVSELRIDLARYPEISAALHSGRPVLVQDARTDPLFRDIRSLWDSEGRQVAIRSVLTLPFSIDRARSGVLFLRTERMERSLSPDDAEFADMVVKAAVAAIRRAQALESTREDNRRLEALATTDPLTRLLNRRALLERLASELDRSRRFESTVTLLLLDLDHFKEINDGAGHLVGDDVLHQLGELLTSTVRTVDIVARYGGEEFVVVLPETSLEGGVIFAERLREKVEQHAFKVGGEEALHLTASIGVASFPSPRVDSTEDFFARADEALYRAKSGGRNQVRT